MTITQAIAKVRERAKRFEALALLDSRLKPEDVEYLAALEILIDHAKSCPLVSEKTVQA